MLAIALLLVAGGTDSSGWERVGRTDGVTMFRRDHGTETVSETLAVGVIDAPPWVVKNAVDDVEATAGKMPYIAEARVIKREGDGTLVVYNRTSAPMVQDRDYTLRVVDESFTTDDGTVIYVSRWKAANHLGPPERDGVIRVHETSGYWRFEPIENGTKTRASYCVLAEPGSDVPKSLAEWASRQVLVQIYKALRTRVEDPKYHAQQPTIAQR